MIRRLWDEHLLPRAIELTCAERTTGRWRNQVCVGVAGEILEIGFGSGSNLGHYSAEVTRVAAVEPSEVAWKRSRPKREAFGRPVERIGLDGARLDLPAASVDAVVSSYTMCTIPDLSSALAEIRRVLRPGGELHFVEHSLSPDADVAARQRRWQPRWEKVAGGCHLDRDIPTLITDSGLRLSDLEAFYAPGPAFTRTFGWLTIGRAATTG